MISTVLSSGEPALTILHVPTFMKEYNEFWIDTDSIPPAWLGKLFGLLCLAALFQRREGEALPCPLEDIEDTIDGFRVLAAQCLIMANYTQPGPHKIEALIVYMASEYFRSKDAQLGVSMIIGIIIRLAMSMGYHRDPGGDPSISVFEGEMIRRRWTFLQQVERLTSFQMGLPTIVYRAQSDTRPPHNILDTDIDPSTKAMPPERSARERTPISFIVAKERVVKAFALIIDSLNAPEPIPYQSVMQLDANLHKVRSSLPQHFQMQSPSQAYLEPADLVMKRYTFEFLFLKGRCVLHRQYVTHDTTNLERSASRSICLDAARQILRHQASIYREVQTSGILATKAWYMMSLTSSDFLLAAMIISLCVCQRRQLLIAGHDVAALGFPANDEIQMSLLQELVNSRRIWLSLSQKSDEAGRAAEATGLMLAQAQSAEQAQSVVQSNPCGQPYLGAPPQAPLPVWMGNAFTTSTEKSMTPAKDVNAGFDWVCYTCVAELPQLSCSAILTLYIGDMGSLLPDRTHKRESHAKHTECGGNDCLSFPDDLAERTSLRRLLEPDIRWTGTSVRRIRL